MTTDLTVSVDGQQVTALVDTGADFSIISENLAVRLKKVKTTWTGPHLRTAGGQLLMPVGRCTARLDIGGSSFVATFVILTSCCKDLIIGMDFLREYGAVINIPDRSITFRNSPGLVDCSDAIRNTLRIIDDDVVVPPRSCTLVSVEGHEAFVAKALPTKLARCYLAMAFRSHEVSSVSLVGARIYF